MKNIPLWIAMALLLLFPLRSVYPAVLLLVLCILTFLLGLSRLLAGREDRRFDAAFVLALLLTAGPAASHILGMRVAYLSLALGVLSLLGLSFCIGRVRKRSAVGAFSSNSRISRVLWSFILLMLFAVAAFVPVADAVLSSHKTGWFAVTFGLFMLLLHVGRLAPLRQKVVQLLLQFKDLFRHRRTFLLGVSGLLIAHYTLSVAASSDLGANLSSVGAVVLLLLPAYIWYKTFRVREDHVHLPDWPGWLTSLVMASFVPLLMAFPSSFVSGPSFVVDAYQDSFSAVLFFLGTFVLFLVASMLNDHVRRTLMLVPFLAAVFTVGVYAYHSFVSAFLQFMIPVFTGSSTVALPFLLGIFITQALFYITGYLSFLYELWRE